ncbi:MAG TPA: nucleotide exchange factor GrpE [Phycisphaerae bacterium]|nr:nucleotide exchange factor GrpE [Phycisphaerae bacterium]
MAQEPRPDEFENDDVSGDAAAAISSADLAAHEIADLKTKLARWQADFANLQRRAAQEVLAARQNADADFAKNMLQVLDHFDMALNVDPGKVDAKTLLDGVKITYDELKKVLANRGIESYDPTGKPFDPHLHEAIMQEESANHAPMMVIQTFQQGFKIGDRVLRPAKVKVSK